MRSVMKHEILGAKEGESLMTPFIKKFMETQMYSNYKQEISEGNTPEIEGVDWVQWAHCFVFLFIKIEFSKIMKNAWYPQIVW